MLRLLAFLLFIAVVTGIGYALLASLPEQAPLPPGIADKPLNEMRLTRISLEQQEGNAVRMHLWAANGVYYEDQRRADLFQVHFELLPTNPQAEPITGTADHGRVNQAANMVTLMENVHLQRGDGWDLRSDFVSYWHEEALLLAPEWVEIRRNGGLQQGTNMVYDLRSEIVTLEQPMLQQ